jgi:hypothetical protein
MTAYSIMNEVQKESGVPFSEIVRLYAMECGYTMHHTAMLLGYASHTPFARLCRKHGWNEWFKGNKPIKSDRVYSSSHNMGSPSAKHVEWDGVVDTLVGHARRLGIPRSTAYGRNRKRPNDWAYVLRRVKHNSTNRPVKPAAWTIL